MRSPECRGGNLPQVLFFFAGMRLSSASTCHAGEMRVRGLSDQISSASRMNAVDNSEYRI